MIKILQEKMEKYKLLLKNHGIEYTAISVTNFGEQVYVSIKQSNKDIDQVSFLLDKFFTKFKSKSDYITCIKK